MVRERKAWDKLWPFVGVQGIKLGTTQAISPNKDPFADWLTATTILAGSSIDKYAHAVRTILQEMIEQNIITKKTN